jgi:RNA polymerase sigma-70 factor (ECF subfamily)
MESAATIETLPDEALLRAIASGESEAIGPLYARYAPTILGMAIPALGRASAEEIVQEVFVAVWTGARSFDASRGPVKPWLLQIAHYRIANELRRRRRKPEVQPGEAIDSTLRQIPDPAPGQAEEAWLAYRQEALRRALEKLPAPQRQALGMSFFEELSHAEIARLLGLPLGTAKARIRSGLKSLRGALAPLIAVLALAAALAVVTARVRSRENALARDERAMAMLTSSDTEALRLLPGAGVNPSSHGVYRARRGTPLAVLTLSNFAPPPAGRIYQAWFERGGRRMSIGLARPDAQGKARLTVEGAAFAERPDALEVTLEPPGGSAVPSGPALVRWPAP